MKACATRYSICCAQPFRSTPIGLFIGWHGMPPLAIFLLIGGVLALLALRLPMPLQLAHISIFMRIEEIRPTRKIPCGVIMVIAALPVLALR